MQLRYEVFFCQETLFFLVQFLGGPIHTVVENFQPGFFKIRHRRNKFAVFELLQQLQDRLKHKMFSNKNFDQKHSNTLNDTI